MQVESLLLVADHDIFCRFSLATNEDPQHFPQQPSRGGYGLLRPDRSVGMHIDHELVQIGVLTNPRGLNLVVDLTDR